MNSGPSLAHTFISDIVRYTNNMFFQLMTDGVARQGKSQDLSRKFYLFIGELFEFSPANGNQLAFLTTKEKNGSR